MLETNNFDLGKSGVVLAKPLHRILRLFNKLDGNDITLSSWAEVGGATGCDVINLIVFPWKVHTRKS